MKHTILSVTLVTLFMSVSQLHGYCTTPQATPPDHRYHSFHAVLIMTQALTKSDMTTPIIENGGVWPQGMGLILAFTEKRAIVPYLLVSEFTKTFVYPISLFIQPCYTIDGLRTLLGPQSDSSVPELAGNRQDHGGNEVDDTHEVS